MKIFIFIIFMLFMVKCISLGFRDLMKKVSVQRVSNGSECRDRIVNCNSLKDYPNSRSAGTEWTEVERRGQKRCPRGVSKMRETSVQNGFIVAPSISDGGSKSSLSERGRYNETVLLNDSPNSRSAGTELKIENGNSLNDTPITRSVWTMRPGLLITDMLKHYPKSRSVQNLWEQETWEKYRSRQPIGRLAIPERLSKMSRMYKIIEN